MVTIDGVCAGVIKVRGPAAPLEGPVHHLS